MITADLVSFRRTDTGFVYAAQPRARAEAWLADPRCNEREIYEIVERPSCQCCGSVDLAEWQGKQVRCAKHRGRNPCAIEGCKRTTTAPASGALGDDQVLCGEHWRRYVPPRSLRRRAYYAHFRRAKRRARLVGGDGWTPESIAQFYRFWDSLVASVRRRHGGGHIDTAEIERLFG